MRQRGHIMPGSRLTFLLIAIGLFLLSWSSGSVWAEDISIGEAKMQFSGEGPEDAVLNIWINITGNNITKVELVLQPCVGTLCYMPEYIPMRYVEDTQYQVEYSEFEEGYGYKYRFSVEHGTQEAYRTEYKNLTLSWEDHENDTDDSGADDDGATDNNGTMGDNENGGDEKSRGFTLWVAVVTLLLTILILYGKRSKNKRI